MTLLRAGRSAGCPRSRSGSKRNGGGPEDGEEADGWAGESRETEAPEARGPRRDEAQEGVPVPPVHARRVEGDDPRVDARALAAAGPTTPQAAPRCGTSPARRQA